MNNHQDDLTISEHGHQPRLQEDVLYDKSGGKISFYERFYIRGVHYIRGYLLQARSDYWRLDAMNLERSGKP